MLVARGYSTGQQSYDGSVSTESAVGGWGCCSRTPEELVTVLTAARQKVPRADGEYKGPAGQFEGLGFGMIRRTGFFKKRGAAGQRFQDPEFLQTLRSILEQVRHVKRTVYFFFFK